MSFLRRQESRLFIWIPDPDFAKATSRRGKSGMTEREDEFMIKKQVSQEIEVRFLEIDEKSLIKKLKTLGAKDLGQDLLKEIIFYDNAGDFKKNLKLVRIRQNRTKTVVAYKHHQKAAVDGAVEIEFETSDAQNVENFLLQLDLYKAREQEKKRHSFVLDDVVIDIDTWPNIPTYVELEGGSEKSLKTVAQKLDLNWKDAVFENAGLVIQNIYKIPVFDLKYFTFSKVG